MYTPLLGVPLIGAPGLMEWILIGLAVVIFFGATKLPKLGKGLGEGIRNFKKGIKGELEEETSPNETNDVAEITEKQNGEKDEGAG